MRIVYCPGAGNGSVGRNRTDAGPIVATYTGAFKNPSAENVRSFTALLGQRRSRRSDCSGLRGSDRRDAVEIDDESLDICRRE